MDPFKNLVVNPCAREGYSFCSNLRDGGFNRSSGLMVYSLIILIIKFITDPATGHRLMGPMLYRGDFNPIPLNDVCLGSTVPVYSYLQRTSKLGEGYFNSCYCYGPIKYLSY